MVEISVLVQFILFSRNRFVSRATTSSSFVGITKIFTRESGALIFETNQGLLDGSVKAQLEEIERGLTDRLNQS